MYAFSARPGFVSSWFRSSRCPTRTAPERLRVRNSADERNGDELEHAGRPRPPRGGRGCRALPRSRGRRRVRPPRPRRSGHGAHRPASRRAAGAFPGDSTRQRPAASSASSSCRPRCRKPRDVAPGRAVVEVEVDLLDVSPARTRRWSSRTSHPKPGASGKHAARAARREPALAGERLAGRRSPPSPNELAPGALGQPEPAAARRANAATRGPHLASASGASSPRRSASQRRSGPGATMRSPAVSASPFPRSAKRRTTAPAASASAAVPSRRGSVDDEDLGVAGTHRAAP